MTVTYTNDFKKHLSRLPSVTQRAFELQQRKFVTNPRHPSLHTKKLKDLDGVYSFRVGRSYRALFFFQVNDHVVFFAIGHRKDIYR